MSERERERERENGEEESYKREEKDRGGEGLRFGRYTKFVQKYAVVEESFLFYHIGESIVGVV